MNGKQIQFNLQTTTEVSSDNHNTMLLWKKKTAVYKSRRQTNIKRSTDRQTINAGHS